MADTYPLRVQFACLHLSLLHVGALEDPLGWTLDCDVCGERRMVVRWEEA